MGRGLFLRSAVALARERVAIVVVVRAVLHSNAELFEDFPPGWASQAKSGGEASGIAEGEVEAQKDTPVGGIPASNSSRMNPNAAARVALFALPSISSPPSHEPQATQIELAPLDGHTAGGPIDHHVGVEQRLSCCVRASDCRDLGSVGRRPHGWSDRAWRQIASVRFGYRRLNDPHHLLRRILRDWQESYSKI